jgi:hypothetical protein
VGRLSVAARLNISPHGFPSAAGGTNGVTFYVFIDWGSPLNFCTDITVLDDVTAAPIYVPGAAQPTLGVIQE